MRTGAKWALAISIVLLVLGVFLAAAGLFINMDKVIVKSETTMGFSYQYSQRISGDSDRALCFIVPGMMSFIAGLASMGYFIYLANTPAGFKRMKKESSKAKEAPKAESVKTETLKEDVAIVVESDDFKDEPACDEKKDDLNSSGED